jgi:signal transduction histidine kinase/CheY-like chemotaxis protein
MEEQLPFFNFSLNRVLRTEPDSFKKAKIKIAYAILIISIAKIFIVFPFAMHDDQHRQIARLLALTLLYLVLIKVLLYRPSSITILSHIMLLSGLATIWSNLFIYAQHINIVTIQFVVMVVLISYYLVGGIAAAIYTISAIFPVLLFLALRESGAGNKTDAQEINSIASDIIISLNFLTFVLSHFLFYRAFKQNLAEKEKLNEALQVNIREVKALAESRSVFLSTMSHELRTPLNGVIGLTHLLKDEAPVSQMDNLNLLEFSANNLLAVINDILDYNKSELDKIELEVVPVNLADLLLKIGYGLRWKAVEKGLNWNLNIDEKLNGLFVQTDPTRLTQIIHNLAGNALKFTDTGAVTINAAVVNSQNNSISIQFSVSDTGIGIAPDRQEAIFNPFTQASTSTTRHYGGTGLGLAIVKRLLKLFNSDIGLESKPGVGSVFRFTITFNLSHEDKLAERPAPVSKTSLKGLKILIAEDNEINFLLLDKLLTRWHIHTSIAKNGQEALDMLLSNHYHCILMDLHMPVMDGYSASTAIRQLNDAQKAAITIIALTASVSRNVNHKIKEAGIDDYVSKPFNADLLYQKLQSIHAHLRL